MGPFPHDAKRAEITEDNPAGTDGFEFENLLILIEQCLRDCFAQMGYTHVANHKTKSVELWQQGDVSYLINAEPNTHATEFAAPMVLARLQWAGVLLISARF